jgi:hypothetical protein
MRVSCFFSARVRSFLVPEPFGFALRAKENENEISAFS